MAKRLPAAMATDLPTVAKMLQAKGRGKDRILAHITAEEARLLKARGGRGSRNPKTGLLEFDDDFLAPVDVTPEVSIPESVTVSAPAPSAPVISAPTPTVPQAAPAVSQPSSSVENVTSTANAAPTTSITTPAPALTPAPAAAAPALPAAAAPATPTPAAAATANAATSTPENVTVTGQAPTGPDLSAISPVTVTPQQVTIPGNQTSNGSGKSWLKNNAALLASLGLGGAGLAYGITRSNQAGQQAAQLQSNLANIAAPLNTAGTQELNTTLAGGLTPQSAQALQATQAQLGQSQAMGAVSAQQVAQSISTTFANLLNDQLTQALNILNQADSYLEQAYLQGYQANVTNATNTQNFYTALAQLVAQSSGLVGGGTTINVTGTT